VIVVRIIERAGAPGGVELSILSTVLVFAGIPAAVIVIVSALVVGGSETTRRHRRYRPGRPYDFQPIWLLAAPEHVGPPAGAGTAQPAIEAGVIEDSSGARVLAGSTGGASDRW
jgi:hypothetical protein